MGNPMRCRTLDARTVMGSLVEKSDKHVQEHPTCQYVITVMWHGACGASLRLPKEKKYETRVFM